MPDIKVSDFGGSMNPNGTISGSMFAQSMQNPNIPYQQTWNNPSWMQQAGAWMNSDSISQGMGMGDMSNGNMIMQADQTGGQLFGMLAGQNQSTAGDIMKSLPGMSTVGNLWNAAFGSHINEEFVAQTRSNTNALKSQIFNSNTNADVLSDWRNMVTLSHVSKDEVGSDGWFSSKAKRKTAELNRGIDAANQLASLNFRHAVDNADTNTDLRISQGTYAYGGPINSFRKYYSGGGYLAQAKALIRNNEGWSEKPYADSPKGKQWRSVGYGFNDSGFREKYPEGISKHYEHGITRKQAEEELDYFLNKAEKTLKNIYGKQWNNFTDNEKAAILDTYYQRPASVGKSSRFYKAVAAGEDAGKYLGVAGFTKRNNIRQNVFGGGQYNFANVNYSDNPDATSSSLQEETILPVVQELDLSGITPTEARALQLNLAAPSFNPSMFSTSSSQPTQQSVPTVGTVEDYLNAYDNMYAKGGHLFGNGGSWMDFFGAWNSAKGGNNYFANMDGSQWKPSDGFQINSGNGNTGDWISQATTAVNTLSNWGSEDPTLGRGGDYSQFGMAAYDLMKTIRDATKSRRESIGQKLGIPIYANGGNLFLTGGPTQDNDPAIKDWEHRREHEEVHPMYQRTQKDEEYWREKQARNAKAAEELNKKKGVVMSALEEQVNSTPFTGEGYKQAADAQRQKVLDKAKEFEKIGKATVTAAELGISGASLLGAWANYRNWANSANMTRKTIANLLQKAQQPLQEAGTLIDSYQTMDGLGNNAFDTYYNGASGILGVAGTVGASDVFRGRYPWIDRVLDTSGIIQNAGDFVKFGYDTFSGNNNNEKALGGHLFDSGGSVGAMGYAQIGNAALKLASNAKYQAGLDPEVDEDKIQRSINRYGMSLDDDVASVNTNGDLLDLWANYSPVRGRLDMRDFRDRSLFDDFLNGYAASWEGFNAGKNFGPWGAAIGAIVGGLSSNISAIVGRNKASNAADEANEKLEKADKRLLSNLEYAAERVDKENDLRILQNMDAEYTNNAADGGKLNMGFGLRNPFIMPDGTTNPLYKAFGGGITHGTNWDTGINWVNEGGSHGENPLGGVPMGMDEQGIPNLVEEGEAIWNGDYVFSKRMKVPKKLREKYNLSDDATFADAVAKLTKDSEERPLSNIDRATNDHILGEFADTQEEMRMAKAQRAMDREIQLREDFLTGFNLGAFGGPLFSDGGGIHIDPSKKGTFKAQASKMGMGVQEAASHILANKEDYSPAMVKKAVFAHNFAHADGGNLFTNPFAYGGEMGNVFAGPGDRPNTLNLDANDQSLVRRLFGDSGFTRFMENASTALNDPLGYFAGDEIESVMNKVANMSKPQMDAFFNTKVGQAVAKAIVTLDEMPESSAQQAGVQRWMKSTGRLARPVYKAAVDAAKRSMAQSRVNARGQMRTPTPKGTRVVKETITPAQIARNEAAAIRAQRNSTPPVLRRTTELAPINRGTTALSNINRGATSVAATGTGATGMSPYISRPTGVGFPEQTMWNATVPFYGGLGIAAGNLLNWEDESGVDAVTGADRRPASSDVKGSNLDASITKRNPKSKETVASYRGKGNGKAVPADVDDFVPVDIQDMEIPQVVETDPEDATNFGDPEVMRNIEAGLNPDGTKPVAATDTGNSTFKPRATWMRQVPIWMSGLAALRGELTPADYTNADTIMDAAYRAGQPVSVGTEYIGDYRTRNPFDERYLMNIINQNAANTSKNIMNLSGGNRAFALTGLFNNDLIRSNALAEAARQGYLANRTDDAQVSEFNRGTNLANMQAQNTRNLALANLNSHRQQAMLSGIAQGARLRQAIKDQRDAAISANWTNFAQNMGDWGKENGFYNMLGGLNDEGILKYFYGDNWRTKFNNTQQNG